MSDQPLNPDQNPDDLESLNKLEKAIQDNDPDFTSAIQDLTTIANENLNLELVDIDKVLEEGKAKTLKAKLRRFFILLNSKFVKSLMFIRWIAEYSIKELAPLLLKKLKITFQRLTTFTITLIANFKSLSKRKKILLVVFTLGLGALLAYFNKLIKGGFIKAEQKPFIYSMEELAENKYFFEANELEPFYSSPRFNQNVVALRRIVVNLKRSKNSSLNPMGAFEFFLQGNSSDVMIEVKDRESEILDLFQIEMRMFNYEDLETVEGKSKLVDKLKIEINKILVRGKINKIYYKTFILKR